MSRTVELDLASDHKLARDLVAGGVFVPGVKLAFGDEVALLLRNGDVILELRATCVWVDGNHGSGLQLVACDAELKQRIATFAHSAAQPAPIEAPIASIDEAELQHAHARNDSADAGTDEPTDSADAAADEQPANEDDEEVRMAPPTMHERLRGLSLVQQIKMAQHGEVQERVLLERMYGKNVWEALLRNPRLTGPEVARIARMGALPRTLVEIIVGNGGWLQIPEVRRALLSNPRLGTDQILRVLRLLPKHELKLAATQTAYPFAVRDAAKRMIRELAGG